MQNKTIQELIHDCHQYAGQLYELRRQDRTILRGADLSGLGEFGMAAYLMMSGSNRELTAAYRIKWITTKAEINRRRSLVGFIG